MKKTTTTSKLNTRTVPVDAAVPKTTTQPAVATAVKTEKIATPTHEEISRRAYEIFVARGQTHGREMEDWVQAERELSAKTHRNN